MSFYTALCILAVLAQAKASSIAPDIKEGPENLLKVDGSTAVMKCRVSGDPTPEVTWMINDVDVTAARYNYNLTSEGDLVVHRVTLADAGRYQCYAKNEFGEKSAFGSLSVKRRTILTIKPESYQVAAGAQVALGCAALADDCLNLEVFWLKDGQRIDFDKQPRFEIINRFKIQMLLHIKDVEEQDSGEYTCVARTEIDEARANANLRVQRDSTIAPSDKKKPGPVRSLEAFPLGSSAMLLKWEKPLEDVNYMTGYKIYYQKIRGTDEGPVYERYGEVDPTFNTAKVFNLDPNTRYRIGVRAKSRAGTGPEVVVEQTTRPQQASAKPDVPMFSFSARELKGMNPLLLVRWHPKPVGHPGTYFIAWYRLKGRLEWSHTREVYEDDYAMLMDLEPGQVYEVKISAHDGEYSTFSDIRKVVF